jgi:toxin ParE1/3/4
MKKRIQFSPAARQDLRDIWRGLAEHSTLTLADAKTLVLQEKLLMLSRFPEAGRRREDLVTGMRSFPAAEFVIFYQIFDDSIQIIRILNGRRDIQGIFQPPEN